ncbi:MAG: type II/IV secretion system protein, partial [Rhodocyclaceae bacterium]|nr:type II/IV secretion system protein [Rhodocyclaceae bacterium]
MNTRDPLEPSPGFSAEAVAAARRESVDSGRRFIDVLESRSGLAPVAFVARLAAVAGLPALDSRALFAAVPAFEALPFAEALRRECLALREADGRLLLVVADPYDFALRDWAEACLPEAAGLCLAHRSDVLAWLAHHEESLRAMENMGRVETGQSAGEVVEDLSLRSISEDASPVVRLVNSTLYDALKAGASDIHLESTGQGMVIKQRLDGVLVAVGSQAGPDLAEQVISRIKVMAELDIAERRVPQDGRFRVSRQGREVDVRVSVMPSIHGEDAVLRILDRRGLADELRGLTLDSLGFDAEIIDALRGLATLPYGMLLVTGPTGSGKTTTLYAALGEINHGHDKIVTIEDPVEYQLPGILQIPVNEKKGLTFARGLRSILRHDPDKIMVGEIRDPETAQIAVQAALTGHLVFTTVHANNVFDVIGRFMHMGVDPYNFVSALTLVLAQRLVRVLCRSCRQVVTISEAEWRASGIDPIR